MMFKKSAKNSCDLQKTGQACATVSGVLKTSSKNGSFYAPFEHVFIDREGEYIEWIH